MALLPSIKQRQRVTAHRKGRAALLAVAAAAALLALTILGGPPLSVAASVQTGGIWDTLYRDGWWRQATGFGLLGCALVAAAGFPLRKRWRRLRWGNLRGWFLAHGLVGALALCLLVAHTGLRLGSGFNRVLMLAFLFATLLGALAAQRMGGPFDRLTSRLHLFAVWPLPVLLAFHILATYYF